MRTVAKTVILVCIMTLGGLSAATADALKFYYHDRPPLYRTQTDGTVGGIVGDRVQAIIALAELKATWIALPPPSQLRVVRENAEPLCAIGWFKTQERQRFAEYTLPIYQDPPLVVITRDNNAPVMAAETLAALFQNRMIQAAFRESYSYGIAVDNLIARHNPIALMTFDDNFTILDMVRSRTVDYALMNADEAQHLLGIMGNGSQTSKLVTRHLADLPEGNRRYLMCSQKTSAETMGKLDAAIKKLGMVSSNNHKP